MEGCSSKPTTCCLLEEVSNGTLSLSWAGDTCKSSFPACCSRWKKG